MLKKTITYEDFDGNTVSEDFFFHLSQAELVELELSHKDGLSESLKRIIEAEDGRGIVAEFKNIILTAYGKKSDDGRQFIKNQQVREEFASTEAYSSLFMELVTDTDFAIEFINGIIPTKMLEEATKAAAIELKAVEEKVTVPPSTSTKKIITKNDLIAMPPEELEALGVKLISGEVELEK